MIYYKRVYELFDKMPHHTAFSWAIKIIGDAHNGYVDRALKLLIECPIKMHKKIFFIKIQDIYKAICWKAL